MLQEAEPLFDSLSSLMVLIHHHGRNDIKRHWAVDPRFDGLKMIFNNGTGAHGQRNLRKASIKLADEFHTAFRKQGGSEERLRSYWHESDTIALAVIARLNTTAADNMRRYYDAAKKHFGSPRSF